MRPRKVVVLLSDCEQAGSRTRFVLMTRLQCYVRPATMDELAAVVAEECAKPTFGCVVVLQGRPSPLPEALEAVLAAFPSLLIAAEWRAAMDAPSTRSVHPDSRGPEGVLEAVRTLLARKRGPKSAVERLPPHLRLPRAVAA